MRPLITTLAMLAIPMVRLVRRILERLFILAGGVLVMMILLALTRIPFELHRWLGSTAGVCEGSIGSIVVLGGSGMPSGPELLRLHHAATLALEHPMAPVVVIHPGDIGVLEQMVANLALRGVDTVRIHPVNLGGNTREQALIFAALTAYGDAPPPVAVVTAPENMKRTLGAFRKAGVPHVCGEPAWDHAMDHGFDYAHEVVGGRNWVPDVSGKTGLRYTFWNYLKLEITCLREFVALGYYRLNGWV